MKHETLKLKTISKCRLNCELGVAKLRERFIVGPHTPRPPPLFIMRRSVSFQSFSTKERGLYGFLKKERLVKYVFVSKMGITKAN